MKSLVFSCLVAASFAATAQNPVDQCFRSAGNFPQFSLIDSKVGGAVVSPSYSLEQLSDASTPTDDEKKALSLWQQKRQACILAGNDFYRANAPALVPLFSRVQTDFSAILSKLYTGQITFGQMLQERSKMADSAKAALNDLVSRVQQAQRQRQADIDNGIANYLNILSASRPRVAPQPLIAPTTNCVSRQVMNTIQTQCN